MTSMTMAAAVTTYLFGLLYFAATGTYYFFDSYIPIAVFLGMLLLFTDPSTSPRTELGRIIFGVAYGLSTVVLYTLLADAGVPTFYDKLLPIPILNLSVRAIDRAARSRILRRLDPAALVDHSRLESETWPTCPFGQSRLRLSARRRESATIIAVNGCRSGNRRAMMTAHTPVAILRRCNRRSAMPDQGGRATSSGFFRRSLMLTVLAQLNHCRLDASWASYLPVPIATD